MTAREMHYDFKQKFNKIDSNQNRDLLVPEIDWQLNEAQEVFVKMIAQPRLKSQLGFEINQRTIDDIRTIVVDQKFDQGIVPTVYDDSSFISGLPSDYWFLTKAQVYATKGNCSNLKMRRVKIQQHDDDHEESPFTRSSFEWRTVNVRFNKEGLRVFTDKTFTITKVCFEYIKKPRRIHNAEDFDGGTYDGLTGTQSCELPEGVHKEIVDIAVMLATLNINSPEYQTKKEKATITN
jgi:hypothetical protein